jgi:hypothetical protein
VEDPEEILLYSLERIDGRYGPLLAYEALKIKQEEERIAAEE